MEDDSCVLNYIEIVPLADNSCSDVSSQVCPVKVSVSKILYSRSCCKFIL